MRNTNIDSSQSRLHTGRERPKKAGLFKVRFIIAGLAALCPVVCYISRQNLPFAIVSMASEPVRPGSSEGGQKVNDLAIARPSLPDSITADDLGLLVFDSKSSQASNATGQHQFPAADQSDQASGDTCPKPAQLSEDETVTSNGFGPKYPWSADDKGLLLGAFFWTYVAAQIPMARLAERTGAKWPLALATAGSAIFSLLSPWAASVHVHLLSLIRILMGVCQAAIYPICYLLYSKWLPPIERSQGLPVLIAGAYVGSIIASSLTGYFSELASLGWEWAFYAPGILCLIWTGVWIVFASNEPREHPSISIEELVYIESKMEVQRHFQLDGPSSRPEMSWRKLFKSRSIWIMIVAFLASNWSFSVLLMLLPTYLSKILHITPIQSGIINSIIYVLCCISSPLVGVVSTMMVETRACGLSRLNIRKLFEGVALLSQAICFVLIPLLGCAQYYVFAVLFIQIILFSCVNGGEVQLPTELSADFSGTIYAIGNCIGSTTGFIVPMVFSQIVRDETSREQWALNFYLAAAISALGGLIFLMFGQNKLQNFAKDLGESRANIYKSSNFTLELPITPPPPPPPAPTNEPQQH